MRKLKLPAGALLTFALLTATTPAPARADDSQEPSQEPSDPPDEAGDREEARDVPEFDFKASGLAVAVIGGALMVVHGRRRRRVSP